MTGIRVTGASSFAVAWIVSLVAPTSVLAGPPREAIPRSVMLDPIEVHPIAAATPVAAELPPPDPSVTGSQLQCCSAAPPMPPSIPHDGKGPLAMGGMMMIGGATLTGLGIGVLVDGSEGLGLSGIVGGIATLGAGIGTTLLGVHRQRRYREWKTTSPLQPPRQGHGLFGALGMTMVGTGGMFVLASSGLLPLGWGPASFGLGGTGLAVCGFLLFAGISTNAEFHRWRRNQARVLPTTSFGSQGMQLGLAGRF